MANSSKTLVSTIRSSDNIHSTRRKDTKTSRDEICWKITSISNGYLEYVFWLGTCRFNSHWYMDWSAFRANTTAVSRFVSVWHSPYFVSKVFILKFVLSYRGEESDGIIKDILHSLFLSMIYKRYQAHQHLHTINVTQKHKKGSEQEEMEPGWQRKSARDVQVTSHCEELWSSRRRVDFHYVVRHEL